MRKATLSSTLQVFLLFLVALFAGGANALAEAYEYDFTGSNKIYSDEGLTKEIATGSAITSAFYASDGKMFAVSGTVKFNAGYLFPNNQSTVTLPTYNGQKIVSVKMTNTGGCSTKTKVSIKSGTETASAEQTWAKQGVTYTYDIAPQYQTEQLVISVNNKNAQIATLVISTEAAGEVTAKAAAPELTAAFSFEEASSEVTITNKEEGGTVYYTTDGSDPTTESEHFTEASKTLAITATTTVKAMATATGKDNSRIVSATYTKKEPAPTYKTVAEFIAAKPETEARLQLTNALVYGNKDNMNIFLHDGTGMIQLFDGGKGLPAGIKYGTRVTATFAGTYLLYSGQHEMKDAKLVGEAAITEAATPYGMKEVTAAEVTEEMVGQLVTVKGVTFQANKMDKGKVIVKDGETALTIYNSLRITVPTTLNTIQKANVSGFVLQYP